MNDHTTQQGHLEGATVLVTGANGGLGEAFVERALARGARKVYATARSPRTWTDERVVPLVLDVNDAASVGVAAAAASDIDILINNAGAASAASLLTGDLDELRGVVETNFWGALTVARAFAPVLVTRHGVLLNVLSSASWHSRIGAYSVSKAALWSASNALRLELDPQGVLVVGFHLGWARTPMTAHLPYDMSEPADVVNAAYDGVAAGQYEILFDEFSRKAKALVATPITEAYPELGTPTAP
jgi:NAD(P)-dependent dehydrogenase (short-subunit alcohol dehydrogenase family)